ncbi:hypothetical protein Ancab_035747 [Ancistrocladus abbreviatus]
MPIALKPLAKILPMSNTCFSFLPTVFNTKALYPCPSTASKPVKLHLSLSLSSPQLPLIFVQKKAFSSKFITFVAQGEPGDTNTVLQDIEGDLEQEQINWDNQEFENPKARLSDWEASGGDEEAEVEEEGIEGGVEGGLGVVGEGDEEGGYPEPPEEAKLFVGNLPYDVDSEKLAQIFEPAGVVEISEVIYNRDTDQSRGFGFVTMSTVEEAEKAVEMFNRYDLNGRLLTVNKAAPRGTRPERLPRAFEPTFRVYVGNLPWDVDNARLEEVFSEYGKVVESRVVYDRETGRSRGFGFVTMASETEMNDAIAALNGQTVDGRTVRVNVAEERPRRNF